MMFRPMPILTSLALASLVILVMLGNWQYARYTEKMDRPSLQDQVLDQSVLEIIIDRSVPGNVQQVYGIADSEPIWRRYAPGKISESGEPVIVMIDASGGANPVPMAIIDLPERVQMDGVISLKDAGSSAFSGRDKPEEDTWYRLGPGALSAKFGYAQTARVAEPVMMSVRNSADTSQIRRTINPYAFSKPVDPLPPERHFGYALTWWGMALGLLGVYVALHHARGRLRFRKA